MDAFRYGLGSVLALVGYYGLEALGVRGGALFGGAVAGFVLGVALPSLVIMARAKKARGGGRSFRP